MSSNPEPRSYQQDEKLPRAAPSLPDADVIARNGTPAPAPALTETPLEQGAPAYVAGGTANIGVPEAG